MGGMSRVFDNVLGFPQTAGAVDVGVGGQSDSSDLFGCPHNPLQGLAVCSGAVAEPRCDGAAEDALNRPSVEGCEDGGWEISFTQSSQKVQTLLGFLCDVCGVESP